MKKISQILCCAAVFAYISASSGPEDAADNTLMPYRKSTAFTELGRHQLLSVREPELTVEESMPPMVGSTLTSIYQTAIDDSCPAQPPSGRTIPSGGSPVNSGQTSQSSGLLDGGSPANPSQSSQNNGAQTDGQVPAGSGLAGSRHADQTENGQTKNSNSNREEKTGIWKKKSLKKKSQNQKSQKKKSQNQTSKNQKSKTSKKKANAEKTEIPCTEYVLPARLGQRKSLESHTAITSRSSTQYRLQQKASTDTLGLRKYQKRYMVAVGTYFNAPVGSKIDVYLTGGGKLKCIVGDIKSDADTVGGLTQKNDGSVVEFIVDWGRLDRRCKRLGSMHALDEFDGYVEKIVVYNE